MSQRMTAAACEACLRKNSGGGACLWVDLTSVLGNRPGQRREVRAWGSSWLAVIGACVRKAVAMRATSERQSQSGACVNTKASCLQSVWGGNTCGVCDTCGEAIRCRMCGACGGQRASVAHCPSWAGLACEVDDLRGGPFSRRRETRNQGTCGSALI